MRDIRDCQASDVEFVAKLWEILWHSAHSNIVPQELVRLRTRESFVQRTHELINHIRVCGSGEAQGFSITRKDELYQLYVSATAQGTGLAKLLIEDAETQIKTSGFSRCWLVCAVGNERASAFYKKRGWELKRTETHELETSEDAFLLECWRFEKTLK